MSSVSTKLGFTFTFTSWSYLETLKSINSDVDNVINLDTSKMLLTLLSSIDNIMSFFFNPATCAGLSFVTSLIIAGVKSFPTKIFIIKNINIANIKLASGPPKTIHAL